MNETRSETAVFFCTLNDFGFEVGTNLRKGVLLMLQYFIKHTISKNILTYKSNTLKTQTPLISKL